MKLSLDWLGQYVELPKLSPEKIAFELTMKTAEAEDVELVKRSVKGIVVGEITGIEPIDTGSSDKTIQLVTVDTGSGVLKTVCGAPNVQIGMKSAFAPPGTELAGGITVLKQELYGHQSEGILCSPQELGW